MSNQYFENNPNLESNPITINFYFKQKHLTYHSDNGVFSKKQIDFGTSLLLKNLSLNNVKTVLDVGCGIGIMGIAIASIDSEIKVEMVDINDRAIELCKKNIIENKVENAVTFKSDMYENVSGKYDLIVTNPPIRAGKKVVHGIILGAIEHLNEGGNIYLVIQKKQGADSAIKALKECYKNVDVIAKDNGYYIIKCTK